MDWKKSLTQSRKDAKNTSEATGSTSCRFEVQDLASVESKKASTGERAHTAGIQN